MSNAFNKGIIRAIRGSLGRFIAIVAIVALGCGFYAGLLMCAPDMKLAADTFFDNTALMDIRVVSTLGMTDDDLDTLRDIEGVSGVMGAYETDITGVLHGEGYAIRVHSVPDSARFSDTSSGVSALSDDSNYLNRPILTSGRWPTKAGECVISSDIVIATPASIGDVIQVRETLEGAEDMLVSSELVVVGTVSSSYYATSSSMGTTSLGSGTIQDYIYVCEDEFSEDTPYTEAFISVSGALEQAGDSSAYDDLVSAVKSRIEDIADVQAQARTQSIKDDAQAELDEAWEEYAQERADAESELADAQAELDDAAQQLSDAATQLADAERQLDEAQATLDASEAQIQSGQEEYDAGVTELASQRANAEYQLQEAQATLDAKRTEVDEAAARLPELQEQLQQVNDGIAQISQTLEGFGISVEELASTITSLEDQIAQIEAALLSDPTNEQLLAQKAQLEETHAALVEAQTNYDSLNASKTQLEEGIAQIEAAQSELDAAQATLDAQRVEMEAQFASAQSELDAAAAQLESGRAQLEQGKAEYESGKAELEAGQSEYDEGLIDYNEGLAEFADARAEADESFADAEEELADAQQEIDDIEACEWYVMDREQNYGAQSYESDANRVGNIATVFPLIFFLVAALVSLTTMTRMVEEERVIIGTYKALGYSRARIASKYLAYAACAGIIGALVGILALSTSLPAIIMNAYSIIYFVPTPTLPIDIPIALLSGGLGVGISLAATAAAVLATLRERPALLMQPRAPKAGKRILLEHITPLWRRVSFSWKVTFRNLFRYKKRLAMTVVGIAGCTALLLTGLGLSDSINDIITKQFDEITRYNTIIVTEGSLGDKATDEFNDLLSDSSVVSQFTHVGRESVIVRAPGGTEEESAQAFGISEPDRMDDFVVLRTREGHDAITFDENSVVLSEKLASQVGVGVGDVVELVAQDSVGNPTNEVYSARVSAITENYIRYYVYLGSSVWEDMQGVEADYESVLANVADDASVREVFADEALVIEGVKTVAYNDETIETYRGMLASVHSVVWVLVVAAAALAFIVVYNLTNINITERAREIATLKVLGFTPREVDAYIYRETVLLSILGAAFGLALGVFMESFVIVTAEVDQVMFGREIHIISFVIAFALTLLFTGIVMIAMRRKLAAIDMVESLKSNE